MYHANGFFLNKVCRCKKRFFVKTFLWKEKEPLFLLGQCTKLFHKKINSIYTKLHKINRRFKTLNCTDGIQKGKLLLLALCLYKNVS